MSGEWNVYIAGGEAGDDEIDESNDTTFCICIALQEMGQA